MKICYIDESGSAEKLQLPNSGNDGSTPVMVIGGYCIDSTRQRSLVWDYLQLKKQFQPSLEATVLSRLISYEIKGSDLRKDLRPKKDRSTIRRSLHFILEVIKLLEKYDCKILGRILVKQPEKEYKDSLIYPSYIAWISN